MPRPDFRKLATERLSTPEPIGMRIGMLLGMSEAEFSSSGFSAPADIPFAPVSPAPRTMNTRRKSFAAAVAAVVAEPVPVTSLPFLSASSPFLSATTVVEAPVKRGATPVVAPVVKKAPVRKAIRKAALKKVTTTKATAKKVTVRKVAPRKAAVVSATARVAALPIELPESVILAGLATATLPVVSGPSPVGDLAARTTPAIAGARSRAKTGAVDRTVADRDAVMEAFADELSRLVELLGAPAGRPDDEHERAKVRKFLQISRIYLDNLAVRMK
jgi:hypothetical protein